MHLNKHIIIEKTFTCSRCQYRAKTKGSYDAHMRTHTGEKPFTCTLCDYRSAHSSTLQAHMITHTGEKPFSCDICGRKFARSDEKKRHSKVHIKQRVKKERLAAAAQSMPNTNTLNCPTWGHDSLNIPMTQY